MANSEDSSRNNNKTLYAIIGVLGALVLVLGFMLLQEKKEVTQLVTTTDEITVERNNLEEQLSGMLAEYDKISVDNDELTAEMIAQKDEITQLMERVSKLNKDDKNLRWEIDKLKKEAGTLRDIMKGYLVKIDELNQANDSLTGETVKLSTNLTEVTTRKNQLESTVSNQESLIKEGSVVTATSISAAGLRIKASGKQDETNRASRAEMIRTCCVLGENRITKSGNKTLFVRIISPDGVVLEGEEFKNETFNIGDVSGKFSTKRVINYANEALETCVYYSVTDDLNTGQYIVEMYESGSLIGKTSFDLR